LTVSPAPLPFRALIGLSVFTLSKASELTCWSEYVAYARGVSSDDIESITVLKGPQAAVLYGSRGANGAILITTKTGDDIGEKTEITLNSSTMFTAGYLTLPEQQSIYGTGDFGQYSYLDGKGGGVYDGLWTWGPKLDQKDPTTPSGYFETVQYNSPIDPKTGKRIPTPFVSHKDNFRNFLQQGLTTSNNVSISHKFKEGSFRISLNQLYRRGQTPNTDLKRFGVNMAANYNITRKLHINASVIYNYTYSKNRPWSGYGNSHPYYNILVYMGANNDIRDLRNYWEEGQEGYAQRNWNHVWFNNPWFVAEEYTRPYSEPELIASASLDYDITDDLNFMVKAATDSKHQNQEECKPYAWVGNDRGLYSVGSDRRVDVNLDAMLSYKKRFGEFDLPTPSWVFRSSTTSAITSFRRPRADSSSPISTTFPTRRTPRRPLRRSNAAAWPALTGPSRWVTAMHSTFRSPAATTGRRRSTRTTAPFSIRRWRSAH